MTDTNFWYIFLIGKKYLYFDLNLIDVCPNLKPVIIGLNNGMEDVVNHELIESLNKITHFAFSGTFSWMKIMIFLFKFTDACCQ